MSAASISGWIAVSAHRPNMLCYSAENRSLHAALLITVLIWLTELTEYSADMYLQDLQQG